MLPIVQAHNGTKDLFAGPERNGKLGSGCCVRTLTACGPNEFARNTGKDAAIGSFAEIVASLQQASDEGLP